MRQIISVSDIAPQASNSEFSFDVTYETDPIDETLPGLGLRLYFDSSVISVAEVENVFRDGFLAQDITEDTENLDEDTTTDQFLNLAWADIVNTAWPGEGETPTTLYTVTFNTNSDFVAPTTLNFTGNAASGYELDAPSIIVESSSEPEENLPPTVEEATFSLDENSPLDTVVGIISATDPNGDTLTYSVDGDVFSIDNTGELTVADTTALDFETTPSFEIEVTVNDGELEDTATVTVNLNDIDEDNETNTAPSFTEESFTFNADENVAAGTTIGTLTATDSDAEDTLSFSLGEDSANLPFTVNDSGEIEVREGEELDFETVSSFSFAATVSDGELTDTVSVTVNVNDVPEEGGAIAFGTLEDDILDSGNAADNFSGNGDLLFTGGGADQVNASVGEGSNRLYGGSEDDVIIAAGRDRVFGGAGNDEITGNGESRLYGQSGDDLFRIGASGNNTVFGGTGNDNFIIANRDTLPDAANTIRDFTPADDTLSIDRPSLSFENDIRLVQEETAIPTTLVILRLAGSEQEETLVRLPGVEVNEISAEDFLFEASSLA